ncbi:MAG: NTP transferase domain-containing protein [Acidobacteria bacterium]|nr:NTP transferase domain-containing protein [Acidobacteriota bacterium]
MTTQPEVGLLLLTGGRGQRLGGPKHDREHPLGGTWGGHLVRVFESVFSGGPVEILGAPLPDRPELPQVEDPREGPAVALRAWASLGRGAGALRWWVVACDLPRWSEGELRAWWAQARAADPGAEAWVVAEVDGRMQPLGGFLPAALVPALFHVQTPRLVDLWGALPGRVVPTGGDPWIDVDEPEALARFLQRGLIQEQP